MKSVILACKLRVAASPSTRREWIEMVPVPAVRLHDDVSLHTEGVD